MVTNTKNFDALKGKTEDIFKELQIRYQMISFGDEDLNYEIQIGTFGKLKPLNNINSIFYLSEKDMSVNLIIVNIYRLNKKRLDILSVYKIVNSINSTIKNGNFLIDEELNQIILKSSINCGEKFYDLNKNLIQYLILSSINALENLLISLKDAENEKK